MGPRKFRLGGSKASLVGALLTLSGLWQVFFGLVSSLSRGWHLADYSTDLFVLVSVVGVGEADASFFGLKCCRCGGVSGASDWLWGGEGFGGVGGFPVDGQGYFVFSGVPVLVINVALEGVKLSV